jgi:hypothetical protein
MEDWSGESTSCHLTFACELIKGNLEPVSDTLFKKQSQGRDNVIHFHSPLETGTTSASASSSTSPPAEPSTSSKPTVTTVSTIPTITPLLPPPRILDSLPTNSLNFCKFAIVEIPEELGLTGEKMELMSRKRRRPDGCPGLGGGRQGLLAVPNLMDSDSVSPGVSIHHGAPADLAPSNSGRHLPPADPYPSPRSLHARPDPYHLYPRNRRPES